MTSSDKQDGQLTLRGSLEHRTLGALSLPHYDQGFIPAAPEALSRNKNWRQMKIPLSRPEKEATEKNQRWTGSTANLWKLQSSNCRQKWPIGNCYYLYNP